MNLAQATYSKNLIAEITLNCGFHIPKFGLGTWGIGGLDKADYEKDKEAVVFFNQALDLGIRHIDLAEFYGAGHSEELVAEALKGRNRESFFITSKVLPCNLNYEAVFDSLRHSLKRLKLDYLDLYLIHGPNPNIPIRETIKALSDLKALGLIKSFGTSNFTKERLIEAQNCSDDKIVVNQVEYSLSVRQAERAGILKYCQSNDLVLVASRPLELGKLSSSEDQILSLIAKKYNATNAQIALAWLINQRNVAVICKTISAKHLEENLRAASLRLATEDLELLRSSFSQQRDFGKRALL